MWRFSNSNRERLTRRLATFFSLLSADSGSVYAKFRVITNTALMGIVDNFIRFPGIFYILRVNLEYFPPLTAFVFLFWSIRDAALSIILDIFSYFFYTHLPPYQVTPGIVVLKLDNFALWSVGE